LIRSGYLNPLGHAFGLGSILALGASVAGKRQRTMRIIAFVLLLAVFYTRSRAGLIACVCGLGVTSMLVFPGKFRSFSRLGAIAGTFLFLFAFASGSVGAAWSGFLANDASSNMYRLQIMLVAWRLFLTSPLLGVGLGRMEGEAVFMSSDLRSLGGRIIVNDDDYARILAEMGLIGILTLFFWWRYLWTTYRRDLRATKAAGFRSPALVTGAGVCAYTFALTFFEGVYFSSTGWFYIGFTLACLKVRRR
jgi:O-antigen ligase